MLRLGIACALTALLTGATSAAEPTIEDVKKAWQARQDANKSFRVEWTETVKVKAGSYPSGAAPDVPGPHPPKDHEYLATRSLGADGDKLAGTTEGQIYYVNEKAWDPRVVAGSFDGKTSVTLDLLSRPGWARVVVRSGKDRLHADLSVPENRPLLRLYRPLGGGAFEALDFKKVKLSGRTATVGDVKCVEVVIEGVVAGSAHSVWCDPARDFLPLKESLRYRSGGGVDYAWNYHQDNGRWIPTGWEVKLTDDGETFPHAMNAKVKKLDLVPKFAADAFSPKPLRSSEVTVYEDGALKGVHLVRSDGSKRPLTANERNGNYDELAKTNPDGTPYVPKK